MLYHSQISIMSESLSHFDMWSNESISQINIYDNSDNEDIYENQSDISNISVSI